MSLSRLPLPPPLLSPRASHPTRPPARPTCSAHQEREASEEAAAELDSSVLQSNPLLDPPKLGASSSFAVKRRWDDDVVFKNQSREPKKEGKRFINDTVRNDFHKRFLNKYVK